MTTQWNYDGTLDESKFSLAATISKWEEKGYTVTVTIIDEGNAILQLEKSNVWECTIV